MTKPTDMPREAILAAAIRFWTKVDKNGPIAPGMETPCWIWTGYTKNGYGSISVCNYDVYAHRVSLFLETGAWPSHNGCHRCDVRRCVRPDHVFDAPQLDNVRDAVSKGRASPPPRITGEAHPKATLSDAQVAELRALHDSGMRQRELAARFGVSQSTVFRIAHRQVRG